MAIQSHMLSITRYREYYLGECLLISNLPGKVTRSLVESGGLPSDSTSALKAQSGKLVIKRHKPGIPFISLPIGSHFKLAIVVFVSIKRHW